jgi:hypothetical protein
MYEIIDREEDTAGKWRIRVTINGQTVAFKFQDDPTDEEVQAEAARYDSTMQEQMAAEVLNDAAADTD